MGKCYYVIIQSQVNTKYFRNGSEQLIERGIYMIHEFSRTELLIGEEGLKSLANATVMVLGVGGVGSHCIEALARSGVGTLILVDNDKVSQTNINRQSIAYLSTVGEYKTKLMKNRIEDISSGTRVFTYETFILPENLHEIFERKVDFIVDAIDTVTAKLAVAVYAKEHQIPLISCMGTGNKLDPTRFEVTDIYKTSVCPLAKVMRKELKSRGIKKLKVVYSKEEPIKPIETESISCKNHCVCPPGTTRKCTAKNQVPGSISFVPSVAGLIIAGEVIKDLIK